MTAQHAPLPPSGAPQWAVCSGSVMANAQIPDIEHPRTRAGTASHWAASETLVSLKHGLHDKQGLEWVGEIAPNGVIIDAEMAEGASIFVDNVCALLEIHGAPEGMLIEQRVDMPHIHPQNWGTLDFSLPLLNRDNNGRVKGGRIFLRDYKFGHRENKAKGNYQLIDYMAGLVNKYQIDGLADQNIEVNFQIDQPFAYHADNEVDEWTCMLSDLRPYFNQLTAKAQEVFTNPTFSAGPHCRDCGFLARCPTARASHYSLIDYVNQPCGIDTMTGADMAVERGILTAGITTAKSRLEAIEDQLKHDIGQGDQSSGLTLEGTKGNNAWTVPIPQAIALANMFKVDAAKPGILTPTQTIAAASGDMKPLIRQAIKNVTARPSRGLKLIKATDSIAARAFRK